MTVTVPQTFFDDSSQVGKLLKLRKRWLLLRVSLHNGLELITKTLALFRHAKHPETSHCSCPSGSSGSATKQYHCLLLESLCAEILRHQVTFVNEVAKEGWFTANRLDAFTIIIELLLFSLFNLTTCLLLYTKLLYCTGRMAMVHTIRKF